MRGYSTILFCIILTLNGWAQEPAYNHFDIEEGLPSSQIYQSIQDDLGFMWFGTDQGLVRFDGYSFKTFSTESGLSSNVVFGFQKDLQNRIWLYTFRGGVNLLENGQIITPSFNEALIDSLGNAIITDLHFDSGHTLWISLKSNRNLLKVSPEGIEWIPAQVQNSIAQIIYLDSTRFFNVRAPRLDTIAKPQLAIKKGREETILDLSHFDIDYLSFKQNFDGLETSKGLYCALHQQVIAVKDQKVFQNYKLPSPVTYSIFEDADQNLWIGAHLNGAICFQDGDLNKVKFHLLKDYSVSHIYEDREGNYWFTTLENGIFRAPNLSIKSKIFGKPDPKHNAISTLHINDFVLWVATTTGLLIEQKRPLERAEKVYYSNLSKVHFITEHQQKLFIGIKNLKDAPTEYPFANDHTFVQSPVHGRSISNEVILFHSGKFHPEDEIGKSQYMMRHYNNKYGHHRAICVWDSTLFIGGENGLFTRSNYLEKPLTPYVLEEKPEIHDLVASVNHLFIGTSKKGLMIHNGDTTWSITTKEGLPSNQLKTIVLQNDSTLWAGTQRGICRLELDFKNKTAEIVTITTSKGLISNQINDLTLWRDTLWAATNGGLSYFDVNHYKMNATKPLVHLEEFKVNNMPQSLLPNQLFDHQQTVFSFKMAGVDFRSAGDILYKYRLKGYADEWQYGKSREVRYMLSPGKYQFEAYAQNNNSIWSETPARFDFEISPPFWQRLWFVLSAFLLVVIIVFLLLRRRVWQLKQKASMEVNIAQSQHKALSAQLKPHFVFNALNSVHSFIRKNDKEASSNYLILFSQLVRQILNNSNAPLINLEEEISMVETYLKIEQLRFKERMSFEISSDPNINAKALKIPGQLIQPYVENAIWHGIMNKEGNGKVKVSFFLKNKHLFCSIEDDGIGRDAAQKRKSTLPQHESAGMKLNEQRLNLINAIYKQKTSVKIIDLFGENGKALGTRVELNLPIFQNAKNMQK